MKDIDKLSIEDIAQKIKDKVKETKYNSDNSDIKHIHHIYQYSDFTKYNNEEFIKNIYNTLLQKDVDSNAMEYYLQLLISGDRSKSEIVTIVRGSKEGKRQNIELLGFKKRFLMLKLFNIPFLGHISKFLFSFLTLPKFIRRVNQLEVQSYMEFNDNKISIDKKILILDEKISTLDKKISTLDKKNNEIELNKANKRDFQLYLQTVDYAKEYMRLVEKNMQTLINDAKKRLPKEQYFTQNDTLSITEHEKHKFDNFYIEFEDKFRGDRESIKERVELYLPYIKKLPFNQRDIRVLDVGCGRGEWLELLTQNEYMAEGIDINHIMISKSKELGLDVKEMDVIEYLTSLPNESLSAITGFHIIEHLPFELLIKMYDEALRVLKPQGMVIFETPNPENVFVGTSNFYTDPTHLNPIPPVTSKFTLEQRGYKRVEIKRVSYQDIHYDDPHINHLFASSTDYAVIGYKG